MRIDKFLYCVRVCKTRTMAADLCKAGKVYVNQTLAKPSREINPGDIVQVNFKEYTKTLEVLALPLQRVSAKIVSEFISDLTSPEEYEKLKIFREQLKFVPRRPKGLGRPSKKDRRDFYKFLGLD